MRRSPFITSLLIVSALLVLAAGGLLILRGRSGASISVRPPVLMAGGVVAVRGTGFSPHLAGELRLSGRPERIVPVKTGVAGGFSVRFSVPDTLAAGRYPVVAEVGDRSASAFVEIRTPVGSPAAGSDAPVLVAAGDIASCSSGGDEKTASLVETIAGTVLAVGDLAYDSGSAKDFATCYDPSWGKFKDRTRPVPGNHEYGTPGAAGYFNYWAAVSGGIVKSYYAYGVAGWRVYALNSNCDFIGGCQDGSPEQAWLAADLQSHPTECVVAYWHHPLFSSGVHGNNGVMVDIYRTLYDAGAEIVINGHDHDYERFAPQDAAARADPVYGVREFVVGTGGKQHYHFHEIRANSEVRNQPTNGVLKLTLGSGTYRWQFIPVNGETFPDSGSGACHGSPPPGWTPPYVSPTPAPSESGAPAPSESDPS